MSLSYAAPAPHAQTAGNPWETHTVAIREIRPEVEAVATYDLVFRDEQARAAYRFAPGQFNMLYLPGAGEFAISVSDDPRNTESCAHTIRVAGNVTRHAGRLASRRHAWPARSFRRRLADGRLRRP